MHCWLVMIIVVISFVISLIYHSVLRSSSMVHHRLPCLLVAAHRRIPSAIWLVVFGVAMRLIILSVLIKIPVATILVVIIIFILLLVTTRFVVAIWLLSSLRVLVIWIHVASWLVCGEAIVMGLVRRGWVSLIIIVAWAELLRLVGLVTASNSWGITCSRLLALIFFAQLVVHVVLPYLVCVSLRHRWVCCSVSRNFWLGLTALITRCLRRYWSLLRLLCLVASVGLRRRLLVVILITIRVILLLEVVVSSVVAVIVIIIITIVMLVITISSVSVVVPSVLTSIVEWMSVVPTVAAHVRGRPVVSRVLVSIPVLWLVV